MTSTPPPPPPYNPRELQEKPPIVGWLVPVAGVLALIGAFAPWFNPEGTLRGQVVLAATDNLHSWEDGRIGLVGPIALIAVSVGVIGLLTGRKVSRFDRSSSGPVVAAARGAMIVGVVALAAVAIAWFLVPGQYDNIPADAGGSWDGAEKLGIELSRGPQLGYWLTIVAAVLAIVGGALMLATRSKPEPVPPPPGAPQGGAPQGWGPPPPAYGPPQAGQYPPNAGPYPPQAPPAGYGPPPAGQYPPPPAGYGPPQGWAPPPSPRQG